MQRDLEMLPADEDGERIFEPQLVARFLNREHRHRIGRQKCFDPRVELEASGLPNRQGRETERNHECQK